MTDNNVVEHPHKDNPVAVLRHQLESMEGQFKAALPAHIPVERFSRVLMTAVQNNPDLIGADRRSLWNAAMRSAQDGLLPDGREGAIVIYKTKEKRDGKEVWLQKAQWMPMVQGVMKKARNSGEIASMGAGVVYGGDNFRHWIDDSGEHLLYESCDSPDMETVRRVFAFAKLKDGTMVVETLAPSEVEKIRSVSRAKDGGPWVSWWGEMAKKSAIRRLSKRLPMSTDLDDLIRRDDNLYDFDGAREEARARGQANLSGKLDMLAKLPSERPPQPAPRQIEDSALQAGGGEAEAEPAAIGGETGDGSADQSADGNPPEVKPSEAGTPAGGDQQATASPAAPTPAASASVPEKEAASPSGSIGPSPGEAVANPSGPGTAAYGVHLQTRITASKTEKKPPPTELDYVAHAEAWIEALTDIEEGDKHWNADKLLRNGCNVSIEVRDRLQSRLKAKQSLLKASQP